MVPRLRERNETEKPSNNLRKGYRLSFMYKVAEEQFILMPRRGMDYLFESATCRRWRIGWLIDTGMCQPLPPLPACCWLREVIVLLKKHHGTMGAMTLPGGKSPFSDFPNKI